MFGNCWVKFFLPRLSVVQRAASRNHHNPKIVQLSNAPRHLKILMCSILVENQYRQKGVATISMGHINRRYAIVCEQLTDIAKLPFYQGVYHS
jgi:hypothetical protein